MELLRLDVSLYLILLFLRCFGLQKSGENKRHDVYIAGFFPFGKGVENSDTGKISEYQYYDER